MKDEISHRNHSPYGWWIASYIERAEWDDERNPTLNKRCLAWENTILIQAEDREKAYEKAIQLASQNSSKFQDTEGKRNGHWVFEGLTSLLPIYDKLEDGAELLWVEHKNRTVGKIKSKVKCKEDLEVFDDTPAIGDGYS